MNPASFPDSLDPLYRLVLKHFALDPYGAHGIAHWQRVLRNGLAIAASDPRVDPEVVTLFALLHDSCRHDEFEDIAHGLRACRWTQELAEAGYLPPLTDVQLTKLKAAIIDHSRGFVCPDPTIQACWDADRLDLPRVGILPDPSLLGSEYARDPATIRRCWDEAWEVA